MGLYFGNTRISRLYAIAGGTDTSDATAEEKDILLGKTAYARGEKLTGTLVAVDTSDATAVASDIAQGKTAYAKGAKVIGTSQAIDTSDATAQANDILFGKTAYAIGQKLIGSIEAKHYYNGLDIPTSDLGEDGDFYYRPIYAETSATFQPASHTGVTNLTENSSYAFNKGYQPASNTSTSNYAAIPPNGTNKVGSILYGFDCSSIPLDAIISSVSCQVRARTQNVNASRIKSFDLQMACNGVLKGTSTSAYTTTLTLFTLDAGTWTRDELNSIQVKATIESGTSGSTTYYGRFNGATLTVNYKFINGEEIYRKENGVWVELTTLGSLFAGNTSYIKG